MAYKLQTRKSHKTNKKYKKQYKTRKYKGGWKFPWHAKNVAPGNTFNKSNPLQNQTMNPIKLKISEKTKVDIINYVLLQTNGSGSLNINTTAAFTEMIGDGVDLITFTPEQLREGSGFEYQNGAAVSKMPIKMNISEFLESVGLDTTIQTKELVLPIGTKLSNYNDQALYVDVFDGIKHILVNTA
jgi:hypothetical protein